MNASEAAAAPLPAAPAPAPAAPPMPFWGYKHFGGLLSGFTAGILAIVIPLLNKDIHFMGVGLCALGALNAYLLSLMNRSLMGAIAGLNGGFLLGLISYGAVALLASDPAANDPEVFPRLLNPLLFAALCPLLGTGPLAIAMFFQQNRPKGAFLRLLLAVVGGAMGAAAGLVVYGMTSTLINDVMNWSASDAVPLVLGFAAAGYVLFRLQVIFLLETNSGDSVERPAIEEPDPLAPRPRRTGADDEP
ncbi:MAG: hypothetical protein KIS92_04625 [Planctomycetota bacterium]|nr:hypothetical protein [Planctomycetota bacterium]